MATRAGSNRAPHPLSRSDFHVAILCALTLEADAVDAIFDIHWEDEGLSFGKAQGDPNTYSTGAIGRHNVVLAYMPRMGVANAASVARACKMSFPSISLGLVVGICGVVPGRDGDERVLGDIVISEGVVQYDFGRQIDERFERKSTLLDSLGRPPADIAAVLAKVRGIRGLEQLEKRTASHLSGLQQKPVLGAAYPGRAHDKLFEPDYKHLDNDNTCEELGCDGPFVTRSRLQTDQADPSPKVHFGLVASGSSVMKSGKDRDRISKAESVIAFEMEGAGAWDSFPCVVLKGACDYADSHKNKKWQRYAAAAAAACMKAFLEEWIPAEVATQTTLGPWFLVPYPENEAFVQRVTVLDVLISQLGFATNTAKPRPRVALYGLGGVGKTQIALSYVYWLRGTCPEVSVFWVHASSAERFLDSYTFLAQQCQIPGHDDPRADTLSLVKVWLERTYRTRWLMVIDNADDTELFFADSQQGDTRPSVPDIGSGELGRFVPTCSHGSVLITSRNKQTAGRLSPGKPSVKVEKMTDDEAVHLVRFTMADDDIAEEDVALLASRLEHLPLAIVQATAFMESNSIAVRDYLQLLDESEEGLVEYLSEPFEASQRDSDTSHAVAATWIVSFSQIEKQDAFAHSVQCMISLLDRQDIPQRFVEDFYMLTQPKQQSGSKSKAVTKALGTLQAFCFISRGKNGTMAMHRLVQLVTRRWLVMRGSMEHFRQDALRVVSGAFPFGTFKNRDICLQYLPHARAILVSIGDAVVAAELELATLLHNVSGLFAFQGRWGDAEQYLLRAIDIRQRVLGGEHPHTQVSKYNLASVLADLERWAESESLLVELMKSQQQTLVEEHPHAFMTKLSLASIYGNLERWAEERSLLTRVLETKQRILGEDHLDTLLAKAFLTVAYWEHRPEADSWEGIGEEAEALLVQLMEKLRPILGDEHPSILTIKYALAFTYWARGRWAEAESLHVQVLETRQRVLSKDHPDTLESMYSLALTWKEDGRDGEAVGLLENCLRLREANLGPSHHGTARAASTLKEWMANSEKKDRGDL